MKKQVFLFLEYVVYLYVSYEERNNKVLIDRTDVAVAIL